MKTSTLALTLVGGVAVLGIVLWVLFNNGVLEINASAFNSREGTVASPPDLLPTQTPVPVSSEPLPTSSPAPDHASTQRETSLQPSDPSPESMPTPMPRLASIQIFALLDAGKISRIEALQMLGSRTPVNDQWLSQLGGLIHEIVNQERRKASIDTLEFDSALAAAAASDSQYLAENIDAIDLSHSIRVGEPVRRCFTRYGVAYLESSVKNSFSTPIYSSEIYYDAVPVSKNYLSAQQLAEQIVETWMQSSIQSQDILNDRYVKHAVGLAVSKDEEVFVTQYFC
ncbi:MAG TPA: CAP domain-containing protein [Dehalococcoidia bacterium]|nr:CAP domain-containing protein [Dehalococcoidia bacterium]